MGQTLLMSFKRVIPLFNLFTTNANNNTRVLCHTFSFPRSQKNFIKFRRYSSTKDLPNKAKLSISRIEKTGKVFLLQEL